MQVYVIDGKTQAIEAVGISSKLDIVHLVGQDTVIADEIDDKNAVHFDEDCFIRGTSGRFQIDTLAPISGKAVVAGYLNGEQLTNSSFDLDELKARVKFL